MDIETRLILLSIPAALLIVTSTVLMFIAAQRPHLHSTYFAVSLAMAALSGGISLAVTLYAILDEAAGPAAIGGALTMLLVIVAGHWLQALAAPTATPQAAR